MIQPLLKAYRFLFGRAVFYRLNCFLYWCSLRGMGILNFESDRVSGEDRFLRKTLAGRKAPVVLDVGANEGRYSANVHAVSPQAVVYAFEPHPVTYGKLVKNLAHLGAATIRPVHAAAGMDSGVVELFDYASQDGSSHASLHRGVIEQIQGAEAVSHRVQLLRLDDFAAEHGLGRIDLLKIDTEGNELAALRGFGRHIAAGLVDVIHFEFNEMNVVSGVFFKDFWDFLRDYSLYRLLPDGLAPIRQYTAVDCEIFAYQNIVAFRKGMSRPEAARP